MHGTKSLLGSPEQNRFRDKQTPKYYHHLPVIDLQQTRTLDLQWV